ALDAEPDAFDAKMDTAEDAARAALRESSALVDPWPAFLLQATQDLRAARRAERPADDAPLRDRVVWCVANHALVEARMLLEHDALRSKDNALPLWQRLVDALTSN